MASGAIRFFCFAFSLVGRSMTVMSAEETLRVKLQALLCEHRSLNTRVDQLTKAAMIPSLDLARLKKRKLALRDQITALRSQIEPDIIA